MSIQFLSFKTRDELLRVRPMQIMYFEGENNYTKIVLISGMSFTFSTNIGALESIISAQYSKFNSTFHRTGKKYIVNINYIIYINQLKQKIILTSFTAKQPIEITCSKEAIKSIKERINSFSSKTE